MSRTLVCQLWIIVLGCTLLVPPSAMSAESASAAKPPPPPASGTKLFLWSLSTQNGGVFEDVYQSTRLSGLHADPGFWNGATVSYGGSIGGLRTQRGNRDYDPDFQLRNSMSDGETVDGPTPTFFPRGGIYSSWKHEFVSHPVTSSFTLSGSITFNFSSAQTGPAGVLNAGFVVRMYKLSTDGTLTLVLNDTASTEVVGGIYVKSWTGTAITTLFAKGDRIALFVGLDDAGGTISDGSEYGPGQQSIFIYTDGETANAVADTWIQLSQNVAFDEAINFSGTTLFLGNSASDVSAGAGIDEKEMWTTQESSPSAAATATLAGPVALASQQWRVAPGGNAVEWYSRRLNSFVLSGQALVAAWGATSNYLSGASVVGEIAVVDADGSNARLWGRQLFNGLNSGHFHQAPYQSRFGAAISGSDTAVSAGQRLRLRLFLDDNYEGFFFPLVSGHSATLYYNGTSDANGSGNNSFLRLSQSVSEYSAPPPPPPPPSLPGTPLLDNFNRANETPVSQGGNWGPIGVHGGSGAPLSQNRLQNFPQPGYSYRVTPYLGGDMEAWATISTRPGQTDWLSLFICLQEAGTTGWDGYELRATNVNGGADLWEVRRIDNGVPTVLASTNFEIAAGGIPLIRRNGLALQFWWKPPGGSWSQKLVDELSLNDTAYRWGMIGAGGYKTGSLDDFGGGSLLSLLDQYAPELRFTNDEVYRTADAAIATDLFFPDPNHSNLLKRPGAGGDTIVAAADPGYPEADLSLGYLNTQAQDGDFLAQPNFYGDAIASAANDYSAWVTDANHQGYNRVSYGRIVPNPGTGETLLQYWMFYYYNPKNVSGVAGQHEGDWEWLQVRLSPQNVPFSVSMSQHGNGEVCAWGSRVGVSGGGHPIAYVGYESHANYFTPGDHPVVPFVFTDYTRDDGQLFREVPRVVDVTVNPPRWIATWDGRWGASTAADSSSPRTPGLQPAWDAWAWEATAGACTVGSSSFRVRPNSRDDRVSTPSDNSKAATPSRGLAKAGVPALPRIRSARIVSGTKYGKGARISYCFSSLPSNPSTRPWRLHLTIDNLRDGFPPLTIPWKVKAKCAVVIQPVGGIKPPYVLRYSVESKNGTRSKQALVHLR